VKEHWMAKADMIYWDEKDQWILGEDQNGDLWVPFVPSDSRPYWDGFDWWNPLHWVCYWNSRRRKRVVFLDWDTAENIADPTAWSEPSA
jgi:hypothetical protein